MESDALNVIKTLESNNWELSSEGHIFAEIKLIAAQLENGTWRKIPRTRNGVAHSLAENVISIVASIFQKKV